MARLAVQLGYQCTGDEIDGRLKFMQDASSYTVLWPNEPEAKSWVGLVLMSFGASRWTAARK